jgi:hypothetical protein
VDEHERTPAAGLLYEQLYAINLEERHRDSLTLYRNDPACAGTGSP